MNILLTGGTGFIGKRLVHRLLKENHQVTLLSRNPNAQRLFTKPLNLLLSLDNLQNLNEFDAVINLAGEPIVAKRWSDKQKAIICQSRWNITQKLAQLISASDTPPHTFISASAIGYYGRQNSTPIDETATPFNEFSHEICQQWEAIALTASSETTRVCIPRIGIVLGQHGGALSKMLLPFKLGLGGPIGDGKQGMSWIHIDDLVNLIIWMLITQSAQGVYNATAPNPVSNAKFAKALGQRLNRPTFLPTPAFALSLAMGEMADLLIYGQYVLPQKALKEGFEFQYEHLDKALQTAI